MGVGWWEWKVWEWKAGVEGGSERKGAVEGGSAWWAWMVGVRVDAWWEWKVGVDGGSGSGWWERMEGVDRENRRAE